MTPRPVLRAAIYTRKSTDEGLDQEFNSLDAQRESCEAYIRSQASEGWRPIGTRYDDGGFSGGTVNRPALQSLLADIAAGRVDVVVVYKIDRLTRSLTDFARIIEVFDGHGASFVSVTQQFNTTTSMGRLTLNVLLSFAQFEREVTAERIRDKIAASKKKGMWMGGLPPLGYDAANRRLVVNDSEAETVRALFRSYLELGSVRELKAMTDRSGLVTKIWRSASGKVSGGRPFSRGHLYRLLSNPIYIGMIPHREVTWPGLHDAIVGQDIWERVQALLRSNRQGERRPDGMSTPSLLSGMVFDETGDRLSPSHAVKDGRRYRYYISHRLMQDARRDGDGWRLPASDLERVVIDAIVEFLTDQSRLFAELVFTETPPAMVQALITGADALGLRIRSAAPEEVRALLRQLVARIDLGSGELSVRINRTGLLRVIAPSIADAPGEGPSTIALAVPFSLRRRGVEAKLVVEGPRGNATQRMPDGQLIGLVAYAHRWLARLTGSQPVPIEQIARGEALDAGDVSRILTLAFLAPDIVESIIDGRQPTELTAWRLRRAIPLPLDWREQRARLGFGPFSHSR